VSTGASGFYNLIPEHITYIYIRKTHVNIVRLQDNSKYGIDAQYVITLVGIKQHDWQRLLQGLLLVALAYLITGCGSWLGPLGKPSPGTEKTREEVLAAKEQVLLTETNKLLALSAQQDDPAYQAQRRRFEAALRDYLQAARVPDQDLVLLRRKGTVIILPIEFLQRNYAPDALQIAGAPTRLWKQFGPRLDDTVLDLSVLPDTTASDRITAAVLFRDSLLVLQETAGDSVRSRVARFPDGAFSKIKPRSLTGILATQRRSRDQAELALLTSSLEAPLSFRWDDSTLTRRSPATGAPLTFPALWRPVAGQALYNIPSQNLKAFLSVRDLPDSPYYVLLDDTGYLHLLTKSGNDLVWSSQRAWGRHLYVLSRDLVAVTNDAGSSFAGFRLENEQLNYLGQSPDLGGSLCALSPAGPGAIPGILAAIRKAPASGPAYSRLEFIPLDALHWRTDESVSAPQFPLYDHSRLQFVIPSERLRGSAQLSFPTGVRGNLFETLVRLDSAGTPHNRLVTSLTPDKDFQVWTAVLRGDVRFPDGTELTAQNVVDSWTNLWRHDEEARDASAWLWQDIRGAEAFRRGDQREVAGLQVVNQSTLRILLTRPLPFFRKHLAQPEFQIRKSDASTPYPMGTGPFYITEIRQTDQMDQILCERNPYYHEGMPPMQTVRFYLQTSASADSLSDTSATGGVIRRKRDLQYFRKIPALDERPFPARALYFLALNPGIPPLNEAGVRNRVVTALDRGVTAEIIDDAECTPLSSLFTGQTDQTLRTPEQESEGPARPLKITYYEPDPIARQIAERLAARFTQLGIAHQLRSTLSPREFNRIRSAKGYDILVDSYIPHFAHTSYDLIQLLERGYAVPSNIPTQLRHMITRASWSEGTVLENTLIEEGIIYPILAAQSYCVLPANLRDARIAGGREVDFSRAWFPRR